MTINELNPCPMCNGKEECVYLEDGKYKFFCKQCGQFFVVNAPSQLVAEMIYNGVIARAERQQDGEEVCVDDGHKR